MYVERQRKWIKEVGLEIGDKVLIVSSATDEQAGWGDVWATPMNRYIGQIGVVEMPEAPDAELAGITVSVGGDTYNYPFFVLVKV